MEDCRHPAPSPHGELGSYDINQLPLSYNSKHLITEWRRIYRYVCGNRAQMFHTSTIVPFQKANIYCNTKRVEWIGHYWPLFNRKKCRSSPLPLNAIIQQHFFSTQVYQPAILLYWELMSGCFRWRPMWGPTILLPFKLDGVAPLMTDPPPTNSTTLQSLPYYGFERTLQDNKKPCTVKWHILH